MRSFNNSMLICSMFVWLSVGGLRQAASTDAELAGGTGICATTSPTVLVGLQCPRHPLKQSTVQTL